MFKWVWLVILGLIWLLSFLDAMKDVVVIIKWCKENKKKDFYDRVKDTTYAFLGINIVLLFFASLCYWIWSL